MKKLLLFSYLALTALCSGQVKISELPALTGAGAVSTDVLPIVDVSAGASGSKKITLAELFSTPVPWQGVVITGQYGGTGVANTGKTITLGGNLTTSGAHATTLTTTGTTNVTLPTTGTLATVSQLPFIVASGSGIDPTGATDSTAAIQALIDSAAASTSTRTVYFPPGTYILDSALTLPPKVSLHGSGDSTTLQGGTAGANAIEITAMDSQRISDLRIVGPGYATSTGKGISAANEALSYAGKGLRVSNVEIVEWDIGYYVHSCNAVTFDHVRIAECASHCIKAVGVPDSHVFTSCWVGWGSPQPVGVDCTAIHVEGAKGFDFIGSDSGNVSRLLYMNHGPTVTIRGGNFESYYGDCIVYRVSGNLTWDGSSILRASGGSVPLLRSDSGNGRAVLKNIRTIGFDAFSRPITAGSRTSNVATLTVAKHGLNVGDSVTIGGLGFALTDPNGAKVVTSVPTIDTFTFASTGSDETFTSDADSMATLSTHPVIAESVTDTPILEQMQGIVAGFTSDAFTTLSHWWTQDTPYFSGGLLSPLALTPGTPKKIPFAAYPGTANIQTLDSGDIIFRRPGVYQITSSIRHDAFTSYAAAGIFNASNYQMFHMALVTGAAGCNTPIGMAFKTTAPNSPISIRADNGGAANIDSAIERTRMTVVRISD